MLHIANDQVRPTIRQTLLHQGPEIIPLHAAGILELIDHIMIYVRTRLLVDKGGVAATDDLIQQLGRIGDQHHILFFPVRGDLPGDIG